MNWTPPAPHAQSQPVLLLLDFTPAAVRNPGRRMPDSPTSAPPGSPEKVAVLEARAARGEILWHPDDAGIELY
jgi:hypothetical protein